MNMRQRASNVAVMTRRNLVHIRREPMQLSDVTVQPVLFTLLFIYIFSGGIHIPGAGSYKDFVVAGLLSLNLVTSVMGTAVGISTDLSTGTIDRFRALPIWRPSVLIGRSIADLLTACLAVTIVLMTGLAVGWRPGASAGVLSIIGGVGVMLLFTYALSWLIGCFGLVSQSPESAMGVGFVFLFPLSFVSNAMVATQGMPAWLRDIANWNPVSAVTASVRNLFGNPNPSSAVHAWPMQHPQVAALGWSFAILAIAVPLAARLFRKRTIA
jgi:ABC-2 type transport system permease protein